jgi:hypothetical protein
MISSAKIRLASTGIRTFAPLPPPPPAPSPILCPDADPDPDVGVEGDRFFVFRMNEDGDGDGEGEGDEWPGGGMIDFILGVLEVIGVCGDTSPICLCLGVDIELESCRPCWSFWCLIFKEEVSGTGVDSGLENMSYSLLTILLLPTSDPDLILSPLSNSKKEVFWKE